MLMRRFGGHFAVYTSIRSLRCTPETNTVCYVNYVSITTPTTKIENETTRDIQSRLEYPFGQHLGVKAVLSSHFVNGVEAEIGDLI